MELFDKPAADRQRPLYERIRPARLEDFHGQAKALGPGSPLARAIAADAPFSCLIWGPPGSGKSTIVHILQSATRRPFVKLSAVFTGVKDVREAAERAREHWRRTGEATVLFIDEIHRYNKSQQDALLPYVEEGSLILFGATTENPGFEINSALRSRMELILLEPLPPEALASIAGRGMAQLESEGHPAPLAPEAVDRLVARADGDARVLLRWIELASQIAPPSGAQWTADNLDALVQASALRYDKAGDEHYDIASAFIKSMRGSDPDAAIYWMARMLESGEDPRFVARRMVIFASEDIGLADPRALYLANAAFDALERVGIPEAAINLAHACAYLALAPKSNRSYMALKKARADVRTHGALPVPAHLRNAPTDVARQLGHGADYQYPHDHAGAWVEAIYLPDKLKGRTYYEPGSEGDEPRISAAHRLRKTQKT